MYFSKSSPVERERMREREREARAQMTYDAEQRNETSPAPPLFGEMVRVNPKSGDRETQQIQRKLGKYEDVKHLLTEHDVNNLYGIDGMPPPSPAPPTSLIPEFKKPVSSSSAPSGSASNRSSSHHHHHHSSSSSVSSNINSQRGNFPKPVDSKPPYGGRGFYPGLQAKHVGCNDFRSNSAMSAKGPPPGQSHFVGTIPHSSNRSSSSHDASRSSVTRSFSSRNHSATDVKNPSLNSHLTVSLTSQPANVDNIIEEMTAAVRTPLSAIAATPRKETESKFTFNPVSGKMESLLPPRPPESKANKVNVLNSILSQPGAPRTYCSGGALSRPSLSQPVTPNRSSSPCLLQPPSSSSLAPAASSVGRFSVSSSCSSSASSNNNNSNSAVSNGCGVNSGRNNVLSPSATSLNSSSSLNFFTTTSSSSSFATVTNSQSPLVQNGSSASNTLKQQPPAAPSYLKSDLSLSEDSEEDENQNYSDRRNNKQSKSDSSQQQSSTCLQSESVNKKGMEVENMSSSTSDESETESGSESDSSTAETISNSPPSLPIPVVAEHEETKHRWNLKNFMSSVPDNSGQQSHAQKMDSDEKSKTDDSDSSLRKSEAHTSTSSSGSSSSSSSSSSDSECESRKASNLKRTRAQAKVNCAQHEESSDEENHCKLSRRSSSRCNSSDDSDHTKPCGVVRPNQRKPPSPMFPKQQVLRSGTGTQQPQQQVSSGLSPESNDDRFDYIQRSLQGALESTIMSRISDSSDEIEAAPQFIPAPPPVEKSGAKRGRKGKAAANEIDQPVKKKRGRKRTVRGPPQSESDDEEGMAKIKVPERRRPGRPPAKKPKTPVRSDDAEWTTRQRKNADRKLIDSAEPKTLWEREKRLSSLRACNNFSSNVADSDNEIEVAAPPVKPTARVIPAVKGSEGYQSRDSSCDSRPGDFRLRQCPAKAEESPPKLDVEGIAVQDKKKSDTLRKLFSRGREEIGGKGGGKGKGGKGKGGVIIVESESEHKLLANRYRSPPRSRFEEVQPQENFSAPITPSPRQPPAEYVPKLQPPAEYIPKLTFDESGRPSLWCKIDRSRLPPLHKFLFPVKSVSAKPLVPDTRQEVAPPVVPNQQESSKLEVPVSRKREKKSKSERKSKHHKKDKYPVPSAAAICSSDSETELKRHSPLDTKLPMSADPLEPQTTCFPVMIDRSVLGVERDNSDVNSWSDDSSCSSTTSSSHSSRSQSPLTYDRMRKYNVSAKRSHKHRRKHSKRRRGVTTEDIVPVHPTIINELAPTPAHVSSAGHGVMVPQDGALNVFHQMTFSDLLRPAAPVHHGIYYSYLEHKEMEDSQTEADNISPNAYLIEAKRLKHAADGETDATAQGMLYLEAILSFVLTGHVLERKNQIDTAFSMYSETLKLIIYISKKFRNYPITAQSSIPNKIAVLSLRCESMLYLKLHKMREIEAREINNTINDYFSKPVPMEAYIMGSTPSPHSPTPSPASSIGSQSSGYNSSSDRRQPALIAVSSNLHSMLQKQHLYLSNLSSCLSYWDEADRLIFQGNKEFFVELDRFCGPLTLHSSLKDLVHYVRVGIQRLKGIISHNQATNVNSLLPAV